MAFVTLYFFMNHLSLFVVFLSFFLCFFLSFFLFSFYSITFDFLSRCDETAAKDQLMNTPSSYIISKHILQTHKTTLDVVCLFLIQTFEHKPDTHIMS